MLLYYRNRADEYEKVYLKPERQQDLAQLTQMLRRIVNGKDVLEIACGTGYWTEKIAQTAKAIKATDINETVLKIATAKTYQPAKVSFEIADILQLPKQQAYDALFGGFIWSHIPLQNLENFIDIVGQQVGKGGTIIFIDNNYVEGSSLPITDTDSNGNTYQTRKLEDGSSYEIIKNFPSESFIQQLLRGKTSNIQVVLLKHYWVLAYSPL